MMRAEPALCRCIDAFASFSRVILHDRRGVGLSDPVSAWSPPTLEQWMDDALAVMDATDAQQPLVFASGDNSQVGILVAAIHPERVGSLVLVNGSARLRSAPGYPFGYTPEFVDLLMTGTREHSEADEAFDFYPAVVGSRIDDPAFRAWWEAAGHRGASPSVAAALSRLYLDTDVHSLLGALSVPTLVIHRSGNRMVPPQHGRYLAGHIPAAKYVELPGEDDLWWTGNGQLVVDEVQEFLTGTRGSGVPGRAVATVLFTDIVGSTEHVIRLGDRAWRDLLDDHDRLVRRQLVRFGGDEIKTIGDGFLAVFHGPAAALQCAAAIGAGVHQLGLQVRCGLHRVRSTGTGATSAESQCTSANASRRWRAPTTCSCRRQ
jgi:pimeloyl-ACP methyl ester carboxylesterase